MAGAENLTPAGESFKPYPVMLTPFFFQDRPVLVVGGGRVAERRIKVLLAAGARVFLISPQITSGLDALSSAPSSRLRVILEGWRSEILQEYPGALLVFAATDDRGLNEAIFRQSRQAGRLVNLADNPGLSDFTIPAVIYRDEIVLALSTGGSGEGAENATPALTAHLKKHLEESIGPEYSRMVRLLSQLRPLVKERVAAEKRPLLWKMMLESPALGLLKEGREAEARSLLLLLLEQAAQN